MPKQIQIQRKPSPRPAPPADAPTASKDPKVTQWFGGQS